MSEAQSLLIRLVMHPKNNPHLIDKLIILKGLPYEWVFKKAKYRIEHEDGELETGVSDQLVSPWKADVDINIPDEVRRLTEPITYLQWFPDVSIPTGIGPRSFKGFWDKRTAWGLQLDYSHGPSQELWLRIEDFIEKSVPRGERLPEAVQVAKDQKSEFKTFLARRGRTLSSLEMIQMDVPIVDLRVPVLAPNQTVATPTEPVVFKTLITVPADPQPPTPEVREEEAIYKCVNCTQEFKSTHGLKIHQAVHRREKVKV